MGDKIILGWATCMLLMIATIFLGGVHASRIDELAERISLIERALVDGCTEGERHG